MAEDQKQFMITPQAAQMVVDGGLAKDEALRGQLQAMAAPLQDQPAPATGVQADEPSVPELLAAPEPVSEEQTASDFQEQLTDVSLDPALMQKASEKNIQKNLTQISDDQLLSMKPEELSWEQRQRVQKLKLDTSLDAKKQELSDLIAFGDTDSDRFNTLFGEVTKEEKAKQIQENFEETKSVEERTKKIMGEYDLHMEKLQEVQAKNKQLKEMGLPTIDEPNVMDTISVEDIRFMADSGVDLPPALAQRLKHEVEVAEQAEDLEKEKNIQRDLANKQEAAQQVAVEKQQEQAQKQTQATELVEKKEQELEQQYTSLEDLFDNASVGKQIGVALMVALGGIAQGFSGASINPVLDTLDKTFDKNIEMKKLAFKKVKEQLAAKAAATPDPLKAAQLRKAEADALKAEMSVKDTLVMKQLGTLGGQALTPEQVVAANQQKDTRERLINVGDSSHIVSSKEVKKDLSERSGDTQTAVNALNELIELSRSGAQIPLTVARARAGALQQAAVGKLRLPLTGPGPLTDTEFSRLLKAIGSATSPVKIPALEREKMKAIRDLLLNDMKNRYKQEGIEVPKTRREQIFDRLREQFPDASVSELNKAAIKEGLLSNE